MKYELGLRDLREANVKRCEDTYHPLKDWSLTDWATAFAGEAGEACNVVKKLRRLDHLTSAHTANQVQIGKGEAALLADLAGEIADAVIYADLLAARAGIDLADAIREKFNEVSRRVGSNVFL